MLPNSPHPNRQLLLQPATRTTTPSWPFYMYLFSSPPPPPLAAGDPEYDAFLASPHGAARTLSSLGEYRTRAAVLRSNLALIEAHNNAAAANGAGGFTLAPNRFADWTEVGWVALWVGCSA